MSAAPFVHSSSRTASLGPRGSAAPPPSTPKPSPVASQVSGGRPPAAADASTMSHEDFLRVATPSKLWTPENVGLFSLIMLKYPSMLSAEEQMLIEYCYQQRLFVDLLRLASPHTATPWHEWYTSREHARTEAAPAAASATGSGGGGGGHPLSHPGAGPQATQQANHPPATSPSWYQRMFPDDPSPSLLRTALTQAVSDPFDNVKMALTGAVLGFLYSGVRNIAQKRRIHYVLDPHPESFGADEGMAEFMFDLAVVKKLGSKAEAMYSALMFNIDALLRILIVVRSTGPAYGLTSRASMLYGVISHWCMEMEFVITMHASAQDACEAHRLLYKIWTRAYEYCLWIDIRCKSLYPNSLPINQKIRQPGDISPALARVATADPKPASAAAAAGAAANTATAGTALAMPAAIPSGFLPSHA